jgi:hypothetical protein
VSADAVQNKINDLLWFGETLVAKDVMCHRKCNRAQSAGRLGRIQPELILVGFDQRGDGAVEELIVGLLLSPKAVVIMRLLAQPERSEQRDNSAQPLLEDSDCRNQPLLKTQAQIDLSKLVAGALDVEGVFDDCIDQRLFGGKSPEDGPLSDTGRLGNLLGTHLAAEPFQQRLRRRDECGSALIERQRSGASHQARIVSECSLIKAEIANSLHARKRPDYSASQWS